MGLRNTGQNKFCESFPLHYSCVLNETLYFYCKLVSVSDYFLYQVVSHLFLVPFYFIFLFLHIIFSNCLSFSTLLSPANHLLSVFTCISQFLYLPVSVHHHHQKIDTDNVVFCCFACFTKHILQMGD